jgi:hypothetical protein
MRSNCDNLIFYLWLKTTKSTQIDRVSSISTKRWFSTFFNERIRMKIPTRAEGEWWNRPSE